MAGCLFLYLMFFVFICFRLKFAEIKIHMELQKIDLTQPFKAGDRTYTAKSYMSVQRWMIYEIVQNEMGFGCEFKDIVSTLQKVYDLANKQRFADIAVTVHNQLTAAAQRIEDRLHPVIKMCTLFVNYEGEDERFWTEDLAKEKQRDWEQAGIPAQDLFTLAFKSAPTLTAALSVILDSISKDQEK